MGREIKRVPLDFVFPLDASYHDAAYDQHCATCPKGPTHNETHDECERSLGPPNGEGWQLWQTVSDGPISPVFDAPEKLIDWMCVSATRNRFAGPWAQGWDRETATRFVRAQGSAPSFVLSVRVDGSGVGIQSGVDAIYGKGSP